MNKPKCAMCGKSKRTVELSPSRRQLLFGPLSLPLGHYVTYEYRCQACETKLGKQIDRMLK